MKVIHVVKRFGPVGGMERYVFKLCEALALQGVRVRVVCEKAHESLESVEIVELGETRPKPRWVSMLRFSRRVTQYLDRLSQSEADWIIHSHERCARHQVTTFHGPPMAPIKERKKLWWTSPRLLTWLWLEKRELTSAGVKVLPNSEVIRSQLAECYPKAEFGITAWPAVNGPLPHCAEPKSDLVFAGHEYVRKGLPELIQAIEDSSQPWTLSVVGAKQDAAFFNLIEDKPWIHNQPWVEEFNPSEWGRVLVHPAKSEPYGMVVAEARAAGIPAIVSEVTGAASHEALGCNVLPEGWQSPDLTSFIENAFERADIESPQWTWQELARLLIATYETYMAGSR